MSYKAYNKSLYISVVITNMRSSWYIDHFHTHAFVPPYAISSDLSADNLLEKSSRFSVTLHFNNWLFLPLMLLLPHQLASTQIISSSSSQTSVTWTTSALGHPHHPFSTVSSIRRNVVMSHRRKATSSFVRSLPISHPTTATAAATTAA